MISDNPVTLTYGSMHDDPQFGGHVGLASRGVEIYIPLSKRVALAMWCPSLLSEICGVLDRSDSAAWADFDDDETGLVVEQTRSFRGALETGGVHAASLHQVRNLNGMQAWFATRYVFASTDEDLDVKGPDDLRSASGKCAQIAAWTSPNANAQNSARAGIDDEPRELSSSGDRTQEAKKTILVT